MAQLLHVTWLLEVAGWFAGLLELVGLTVPLKIASFAGLSWFQVAACFSFHFIFFLEEEAFPEQVSSLLTLYFLHVFSPKKEDIAVDFLQVDKLSLVG